MTAATNPLGEWDRYGEEIASAFDGEHAAVLASGDPIVTATVALAIARVQGATRRVAIADLIGEVPPLQDLVTGDDPHGISDSFLYAVSLNKIARPLDDRGAIFLMPSGTEAVATDAVYANERWRRLAAGFHQVGALLLIVATPSAPGFHELCGYVGALLPIGDYTFPLPRGVPIVGGQRFDPRVSSRGTVTGEQEAIERPSNRALRAREAAARDNASRQRQMLIAVALVIAAIVLIGKYWDTIRAQLPAPLASLLGAAPENNGSIARVPARVDSTLANDSAGGITSDSLNVSGAAGAPLVVQNPQDSIQAARFAIYFASANTREGAMPDERVRTLPAVAMTPVPDGAELWYRVTVGATSDRGEAEALLQRMRDERLIGSGSIVRVPLALQLESGVTPANAQMRVAALARRGIVAYALRQVDGMVTIYTGAFETPRQATTLADSLRRTGIEPVLVNRTGRAF